MDNVDNTAAELTFPVGGSKYSNQSPGDRMLGANLITPVISAASGWGIVPWDTNYKTQRAQEWNITLERQLPWKFAARLSYVGTRGGNLVEYDPLMFQFRVCLLQAKLLYSAGRIRLSQRRVRVRWI